MQRDIISRKRFVEAVRPFGAATIGYRVLINAEQRMMLLLTVGRSHGVEVYLVNVTFRA
jgi:hypothetical protein